MDPILFWNDVALEANRVSHTNGKDEQTGPTLSSRALAIVHLAMYDAYAGVLGNPVDLPEYLTLSAYTGTSSDDEASAAVAGAAVTTLLELFPSQKNFFNKKMSEFGKPLNDGYYFGCYVGREMLKDRENDPTASADGYTPSLERGKHRVDPDNSGQGFHAPFYGAKSNGFAVTARHELDEPPFDQNPAKEDEYVEALRQVRGKGIAPELMGTLPNAIAPRNVDETVVGIYWGYDGAFGLGTPPRLYNQIVRKVAEDQGNTVAQNARLFALVNAAMGDAGILAWDQKYIHDFWRPVLGIREHDESMGLMPLNPEDNISNNCDTGWLPLGAPATNALDQKTNSTNYETNQGYPCNQITIGKAKNFTPPFPAYPSGHATFGAAALHITRLFYGVSNGDTKKDNLFNSLTFVSEEYNGMNKDNKGTVRPRHNRKFTDGLWQMIIENGTSRVFIGVHWVFDAFALKKKKPDFTQNIGGVPLGLKIAEDIFNGARNAGLKKSDVKPRFN
jgi:hypothetical protein